MSHAGIGKSKEHYKVINLRIALGNLETEIEHILSTETYLHPLRSNYSTDSDLKSERYGGLSMEKRRSTASSSHQLRSKERLQTLLSKLSPPPLASRLLLRPPSTANAKSGSSTPKRRSLRAPGPPSRSDCSDRHERRIHVPNRGNTDSRTGC